MTQPLTDLLDRLVEERALEVLEHATHCLESEWGGSWDSPDGIETLKWLRTSLHALVVHEVEKKENTTFAQAIEAAAREALEFLEHSGNQRSVLSGKFSTPSARYDWFNRVKATLKAALSPQATETGEKK